MNTRKNNTLSNDLKKLEKLVGNFIQYWGFKKIHGRIWTHLYTSTIPLDSQTLISRLKVSKGLMSLAIRDLVDYEVIEATSTGKHGTTYYKANSDLIFVITNVLKKRETLMISEVSSCVENLISKNELGLTEAKIDLAKLNNIKQMTESAQGLLALFTMQSCQQNQADNLEIFSDLKFEQTL